MDTFGIFDISAAGMNLERLRLETSAVNLANAHTTAGPDGVRYRPLQVLAQPNALSFEQVMGGLAGNGAAPLHNVEVRTLETAVRRVYDPGHPHADGQGFVTFPDVNPVSEMVNLVSVTRAYEANVRAMNAAKSMALKALEIGSDR
jgi:flagellar basal-body rod protein FlgC